VRVFRHGEPVADLGDDMQLNNCVDPTLSAFMKKLQTEGVPVRVGGDVGADHWIGEKKMPLAKAKSSALLALEDAGYEVR
jgi:hypothetical protein